MLVVVVVVVVDEMCECEKKQFFFFISLARIRRADVLFLTVDDDDNISSDALRLSWLDEICMCLIIITFRKYYDIVIWI